ncbi:UDP-N-acetylglucosamine 1-carboxyvinyltransferase [Candidatus Gottesmanbacteria bacterium]|nr:UDP-N-acetylglucosamine 1-carboxyvinyltransferase [Candidatus Gottesmanbacteria bacterium]
MDRFIILGGNKLSGQIKVSGAKNVAMKAILAGLLTDKPITVDNIPLISAVSGTAQILRLLGIKVVLNQDHTLKICGDNIKSHIIPLELGGLNRTATMVLGPLLSRFGKAVVPNPGGCRIGKRPIDRHIEGLRKMGVKIEYKEGYFYAQADGLYGTRYKFESNTHTGTETLILAAVRAKGETVLENAAQEPEVDDLIRLLNLMGAKIRRIQRRTIVVKGVKELNGAEFSIMPDRNEVVTFAIAAIASGGDIVVEGTQREYLKSFFSKLDEINAGWEPISADKTRFWAKGKLVSTQLKTMPYPGFMTDWQAPWVLLMSQAYGTSNVHETVYEDRFGYISELQKMGAKAEFYNPEIDNPYQYYNFNWNDRKQGSYHAVKISGPTKLHNAVVEVADLRAGATLVLGACIAEGESIIYGVSHIDRGYENLEGRLKSLGAQIRRE